MDKYPREHIFINGVESKECKQCNETKSLSNFHKDKCTLDGLKGICKNCAKHNTKTPKNIKKKAKETYQNYEWLYDQYIAKNKTIQEISREINIKNETIKNWLVKFDISIKTISESRKRMLEINEEYREFLSNIYTNVFSNYEPGFKGKSWSEEDKIRIGEDRKRFFSIPENRNKQLEHLEKINNSEEVRNKISKILKLKYENNELNSWNAGLTSKDDFRILAGERHPLFNNWSSLGEYGVEFNKELKDKIIKKDGYCCQECGKTNKQHKKDSNKTLAIHHIDYDKNNSNENNLISLCFSCHAKTNFNREYWENYFKSKTGEKNVKELNMSNI